MILINCDDLPAVPDRFYGGMTGPKLAVKYNDRVWMLKCGQDLTRKDFKNVILNRAYDPISEYIGSSIYRLFDIPVHEVLLGTYHGELCCLCSDDAYPNQVVEFRQFRNALFDSDIDMGYSGMSVSLNSIMQVIDRSDRIHTEKAMERFWSMFVVDALIGNTDRNNGNWGFVYNGKNFDLYEVYDCGGCLNNKRSDQQMKMDFWSDNIKQMALNYQVNLTINGSRINPFHYIEKNCNYYIRDTLAKVLPEMQTAIEAILSSLDGIISYDRYDWYLKVLTTRLNKLLELREMHYSDEPVVRKGFMFIDKHIPMNFPMPEELKEYIDGMDKAFDENDTVMWDYYHEVVGEFAKNCCSNHQITESQKHAIWERYATAG